MGSTLRRFVEGLDGKLEVSAVFGENRAPLGLHGRVAGRLRRWRWTRTRTRDARPARRHLGGQDRRVPNLPRDKIRESSLEKHAEFSAVRTGRYQPGGCPAVGHGQVEE